MKAHPTPLLILGFGIIAAGTLSAKNAITRTEPPKDDKTAVTSPAAPRTAVRISRMGVGQARPLTSRGALEEGAREAAGVLLASPKAILVEKAARRLTIYENGAPMKSYITTIGRNEFAAKTKAGDWATPEGLYRVRRKNPRSKYYLALHIDYPNQNDAERGLMTGLIGPAQYNAIMNALARGEMPPQNTRLGYYIEIHGGSNRVVPGADGQPSLAGWTRGCVGLRNEDIKEIYDWSPNGTPVLILP